MLGGMEVTILGDQGVHLTRPGGLTISCLTTTGLLGCIGPPPEEFSMVCMGTAFPAMPGVPNMRAELVFCRSDAETI